MTQTSSNPATLTRSDFTCFIPITTRWHDNDVYGHINNVQYYSFFDTAVNKVLIEQGGLDIHQGKEIAFVVSSQCEYLAPVHYPQSLEVGVAVKKLGNSSVTYQLALFVEAEKTPSAVGSFVHVFVERESSSPCAIPNNIRELLTTLQT